MGTLAQLVRAKYPDAYGNLSDEELEAKVDAKYPGTYDKVPRTKRETAAEGFGNVGGEMSRAIPARDALTDIPRAALAATLGAVSGPALAMAGPEAAGAAAGVSLPSAGQVGIGLLKALSNPYVAGGISGARTLARTGSPLEAGADAVKTGAEMALLGHLGGRGMPLLGRLAKAALGQAAPIAAEAAPAVAEAAAPIAEAAPAAYRGIPSTMRIAADEVAPGASKAAETVGKLSNLLRTAAPAAEAAPVAQAAAEAAPGAAKAIEAATKTVPAKTVVQFAKEIAKSNPKVGEKIWILLDDAGAPLKRLTSDEAASAARKGLQTTWVKNLW